jgi:hypothetical protein
LLAKLAKGEIRYTRHGCEDQPIVELIWSDLHGY